MIWELALIFCVIVYISRRLINYRWYWTKKGVKQIPVVAGLTPVFTRKSFPETIQIAYQHFPEDRYIGFYQFCKPVLMLRDPDLIRQMVIKDFDHFTDHYAFVSDDVHEPLWSKNIFILKGRKWREMRATLSPAFTSSKMKGMFHLMTDCAKQFTRHFDQKDEDLIEVDVKDIFTRYATDVIGNCAFGVQSDSLEHKNNEFYIMGKEVSNLSGFWRTLQLILLFVVPKVAHFFGIYFLSKKVNEFFLNLVQETVDQREKNNIVRPDMIHLLMEARKGRLNYEENQTSLKETGFATVEESTVGITTDISKLEITMADMTAQAVIFFNAGFDAMSTIMSFMGYELSLNPDLQQRLYDEIQQTIEDTDGNVNYEVLNRMKYLDMVMSETLRKWPIAVMLDRECVIPYTIKPERDSEVEVNLTKYDVIWIPVWGIHYDPQYYPNPDKFDPERFSDENKHNIKPYTYLPFGIGPRNCIGSRFALLEGKALIFNLLSKYEFVVTENTTIPLRLKKSSYIMAPEKKIILGLKKRSNIIQ